jgi:hypothetical protein
VGALFFFGIGVSALPVCAYSLWGVSALCLVADLAAYYHIHRSFQHAASIPIEEETRTTDTADLPTASNDAPSYSLNLKLGPQEDFPKYPPTLSKPFSTVEYVKQDLKFHQGVQQQGRALGQDFYYQKAQGGGNCFYLSYLSAILHYLVATDDQEQFSTLLNKLKEGPETLEQATCLQALEKLQQAPTCKNLYQLIENTETFTAMALYLRQYAVNRVSLSNIDEDTIVEPAILARDHRLPDFDPERHTKTPLSKDLSKEEQEEREERIYRSYPGDTKKARYCYYQGKDGIDVQDHEIMALHKLLFPIRIYYRLDTTEGKARVQQQGLFELFSPDSPVTLFQTPNHFDVLLPKKYTRYIPDFSHHVVY